MGSSNPGDEVRGGVPAPADDESAGTGEDSNVTAGPAEEEDRKTPDDRGLTTDTTSSG